MPSREKRCKAHLGDCAVHFLRSGFRATVAKLRPFSAISSGLRADFSALQTVRRRGRDSNPRYVFAKLSLDMSVSCRQQNPTREFKPKPRSELCIQSGFDSPSIRTRRRTSGDSVAEWSFCELPGNLTGFASDCVHRRQSHDQKFSPVRRTTRCGFVAIVLTLGQRFLTKLPEVHNFRIADNTPIAP